jgi:hypothetical protein
LLADCHSNWVSWDLTVVVIEFLIWLRMCSLKNVFVSHWNSDKCLVNSIAHLFIRFFVHWCLIF